MTTSESGGLPVTYADVERARERLDDDSVVKETPVERSSSLDEFVGGEVYLKMEHLQWTGSFKTRGAYNKISQAVERGVDSFVAASAGNHAQGVALAATNCGAESTIFMPENAPQAKIDATRGYGAEIVPYDPETTVREELAAEIAAERNLTLIPSFDHPDVVPGQGTAGKELFEEVGELDTLLVCCGGGGLLSGCAMAADALSPGCRVVGVDRKSVV